MGLNAGAPGFSQQKMQFSADINFRGVPQRITIAHQRCGNTVVSCVN